MKLSKIALSVVAVIGVSVVGGSWYTGKQVEEKYQALVVQANNQLKQLSGEFGANIELKDVQIDRHFFSSDAKYRLEVDFGDGKKLDFIGNDKLHHGPLPLNRLAKFNFAPVMMSMENSLQGPEIFKKFVGEQIGSGLLISAILEIQKDILISRQLNIAMKQALLKQPLSKCNIVTTKN